MTDFGNETAGPAKAVAIADERGRGDAPRVTAIGIGPFAEKILSIAFENGVRVREDAALVDILAALDVDSQVPLEALPVVTEILSYVYRANGEITTGDMEN